MEPQDQLAHDLLTVVFNYARESSKTQSDARYVSRDVFNALARVTAGFLAFAVEPERIDRGVIIVLEHMNAIVLSMIPESSRAAQAIKQQFRQEDKLEELLDKPGKSDDKVS